MACALYRPMTWGLVISVYCLGVCLRYLGTYNQKHSRINICVYMYRCIVNMCISVYVCIFLYSVCSIYIYIHSLIQARARAHQHHQEAVEGEVGGATGRDRRHRCRKCSQEGWAVPHKCDVCSTAQPSARTHDMPSFGRAVAHTMRICLSWLQTDI